MRRSREEWSALLAEHEASGQSLPAFCRRHGLEPRTLQWWQWKLTGSRRTGTRDARAIRLVPVDVLGSAGTADAEDGPEITIEVGDVRLRIATGTSPAYVAQLVAALRVLC